MTEPCLIFRAIQLVHDKLVEANAKPAEAAAETSTKADTLAASAAILWEHIAQVLSTLKLPYDTDTHSYARCLAPLIRAPGPVLDRQESAGRVVLSMRADSQQRLELWAEAVVGMPNIASSALPAEILYLYCLRAVGLGMLGPHAAAICGNLANNTATSEGRRCLRKKASLSDYVKHGLEPHRYNRLVLMSFIGFANCTVAGVSPDDDREEAPPLPLVDSSDGEDDYEDRKHNAPDGRPHPDRKRARNGATTSSRPVSKHSYAGMYDYLFDLRNDELRDVCERYNLGRSGNKDDLIDKIIEALGTDVYDDEAL